MNRQRQKLPLTRGYGFQPGIRELWLNIGFSVAIECGYRTKKKLTKVEKPTQKSRV